MSRAPQLLSLWALVSFVLLLALQWFPYTGLILMILGASMWCGLALHVFLLGLFFEAALNKLPRFLMIIPLAAYSSYYIIYAKQSYEIEAKAQQMRQDNPSIVLQFDSARHSLVAPPSRAEHLVSSYDLPVAYKVDANFKPEGYLSYRLLDQEQCATARNRRDGLRGQKVSPAAILVSPVRFENVFLDEVCVLRFPEKPPSQQIVVANRGDDEVWKRKREIMEQFVDFSINGEVFATYRTASVWRLPAFPMVLIGCGLNSAKPSWDCFADFYRTYQVIDGTPKSVDKTLHDSPESIVLGLRKYAQKDYADFKGDSRSSAFVERIGAYPQEQAEFKIKQDADLFAQFAEFVRDRGSEPTGTGGFAYKGKLTPPDEMANAVLEKTEQLVLLRDAIVARFVQLIQSKIDIYNKWFELLSRSLVALPRDAFAAMPDQEVGQLLDAFAWSARNHGFYISKYLYLRMADAGPRALNFYESELAKLQNGHPSAVVVTAICRIGEASDQTKTILKDAFLKLSKDTSDDSVVVSSAMFVALLKLGDSTVVNADPTGFMREDVIGWYDAIRQGKGRTDVGPNNCQGWDNPAPGKSEWWPSWARSSLVYKDKAWIDAGTK